MPDVYIQGQQRRLPVIRLDSKDYFIMGGSYQRLYREKIISEQYGLGGGIDRQSQSTSAWRWQFTLLVPQADSQVTLRAGFVLTVGDIDNLHTSMDKEPPNDLLNYYDITRLGVFTGTYTHRVYAKIEWESPHNDDPTMWQVPIQLWGNEA